MNISNPSVDRRRWIALVVLCLNTLVVGIEGTILDGDAIRELGMGAFAAVAQGSAQSARLIRLDYEGPGASERPRLGLG